MLVDLNIKRGVLIISQQGYLEKIVSQFQMQDAKHVLTLIGAHFKMMAVKKSKMELESSYMKNIPYLSCVGCVVYAMLSSQPSITYGVGLISTYISISERSHWQVAKWLLQYLKGSLDLKLVYSKNENQGYKLLGYLDK